jgi:anti-sigma B factor antagonist
MDKGLKLAAETVDGGMFVLTVDGEIDLYTAPELERELLPGVENGATGVLIDLTDCRFIDSTALGVLLRARGRLNGARGIALVAADPHVRKVFEVTGLDRIFAIHPTRAAALAEASGD